MILFFHLIFVYFFRYNFFYLKSLYFISFDLTSTHDSYDSDEKDAKDGKSGAKKDKPVEKSLVVLEVKPWEADTNLEEVRTFAYSRQTSKYVHWSFITETDIMPNSTLKLLFYFT